MDRRHFIHLSGGGMLIALAGCGGKGDWPEGMQEIKWDRDTCARCSMVIYDRRFAAEMRGGPKETVFKFDDIGCAVFWLREKAASYPWMAETSTRLWVADANSRGKDVRWLDAYKAQYFGKVSPMGYNFGAVALPQPGSTDFPDMRSHVLVKGK